MFISTYINQNEIAAILLNIMHFCPSKYNYCLKQFKEIKFDFFKVPALRNVFWIILLFSAQIIIIKLNYSHS